MFSVFFATFFDCEKEQLCHSISQFLRSFPHLYPHPVDNSIHTIHKTFIYFDFLVCFSFAFFRFFLLRDYGVIFLQPWPQKTYFKTCTLFTAAVVRKVLWLLSFKKVAKNSKHKANLNIKIRNVLCVFLYEISARLNLITHKKRKRLITNDCVLDCYLL